MQSRQTLALKYRPKTFEDLIGQDAISQTLSLGLDTNRLANAYLFSGLRGSGKTSTARILAKALICDNGPTSKPCEKCPSCLSANDNKHLDIIEMDAASNRGIDDIKELIEHTKYKPSSARFKVFIIDEVHMLTNQAFNALLKTLEEPPEFVKFILATTDALKLPVTILSRTQHFRFKKISNKDVVHHLNHILNLENVEFETNALELLARVGEGSLRDTLTLLDQAIVFCKEKLNALQISEMLGLVDTKLIESIFQALLNRQDYTKFLEELKDYDASLVCDEFCIYLRQKMLERDPVFSMLLYDRFFRILADSKHLLSINSDSIFVLLLMFSKMSEATQLKSIDELLEEVEEIKTKDHEEKRQVSHKQNLQNTKEIQDTRTTQKAQSQEAQETQAPQEIQITPTTKPHQEYQAKESTSNVEPKETQKSEQNLDIKKENTENITQENIQTNVQNSVQDTSPSIENKYETMYKTLQEIIYKRDYDLGELFEQNFIFQEFKDNTLFIQSYAEGEAKKYLWKYFSFIRNSIEQVYGNNCEIEFIKVKKKLESKELKSTDEAKEALPNQNEVLKNEAYQEAQENEGAYEARQMQGTSNTSNELQENLRQNENLEIQEQNKPNEFRDNEKSNEEIKENSQNKLPSEEAKKINEILQSQMITKAKELFSLEHIVVDKDLS